jgi:hypothetical protein
MHNSVLGGYAGRASHRSSVNDQESVLTHGLALYNCAIQYRSQYRGFVNQPAFGEAR